MRKLGLIGGLGPESTMEYYRSIILKYQNRKASKEVLPEFHINSISMYKVFEFIKNQNLQGLTNYLVNAVKELEAVGCEFAAISANTPHIVFDDVQKSVNIELISIVEETKKEASNLRLKKLGLLGTMFTMENDFFLKPFLSNNIEVYVPSKEEQRLIHEKIVAELENGIVNEGTKQAFLEIVNMLVKRHEIEGIILGCTELPMIINQDDLSIHTLNTTEIHIEKIVAKMFETVD